MARKKAPVRKIIGWFMNNDYLECGHILRIPVNPEASYYYPAARTCRKCQAGENPDFDPSKQKEQFIRGVTSF